jgi:predicted dehydrogenase
MSEKIRWGILAPGAIARKFAVGLLSIPDAEPAAVASRSLERAQAFAKEFHFKRAYGSYEELARDPEVDAVYVASPHAFHCEHSLLCVKEGKAVLCEKPFTLNAIQLERLIAAARGNRVPLLEAMWTRFLPVMVKTREWIREGRIGKPRLVVADFGFAANFNPQGRHFDPALGGGGLLDVGVYPLSLASMVYGGAMPDRVQGLADIGSTGVDEQAIMTLGYGPERLASLGCAVRTAMPQAGRIIGSEGAIEFAPPFWKTTKATLVSPGAEPEIFEQAHQANGYEYEAMELMRMIRGDLLESPDLTHAESMNVMRTMDLLRRQWGVRYPGE